jgi:acyl carrier protein
MYEKIRVEMTQFIITNYLFGNSVLVPGDDDSLIDAGIIDSTGILELIEFLESNFGIEVSEVETVPANLDGIARLTKFVESKSAPREP